MFRAVFATAVILLATACSFEQATQVGGETAFVGVRVIDVATGEVHDQQTWSWETAGSLRFAPAPTSSCRRMTPSLTAPGETCLAPSFH